MTARVAVAVIAFALAAAGCGAEWMHAPRFRNQPIVWRVNDRIDTPNKPEERQYWRTLYHVDGYVVRRVTRAMEFQKARRAQNVNALDEVPDSTWFTNRIGIRDMPLDEIKRGPNDDPAGPEAHKPWTIKSSKVGGTAVGFVIEDSQGTKYLLKFDDKRGPEVETAADIIGQRLIWACGYNVPEDAVVYFKREDLVVAKDAKKRDVFGDKSPMTVEDLEAGLARVDVGPDGVYRGLASKYLDGIPIGTVSREGVREDDPNDRIPHELRRELRGAFAIFEWLNHTDLQEDNTLDAWVEDPQRPGRHYVVHHFIDFGKALGVMGFLNRWNWVGFTYRVDVSFAVRSLFAFGLWKRPYEGISSPPIRGVGLIEVDKYEPGSWRPNSFYWPLEDKDRFDAFWGAKILIRLTRDHIKTAVEQGRLTDASAIEYLTETLVGRQRKTARHWFRQVAPLDRFEVGGDGLCFEDMTARYELEDVTGTRYEARAYDRDGHATGWTASAQPGPAGRVCLAGVAASRSAEGYTFVRIATRRRDLALPATQVHLATDPATGALRVIGIWRE